MCLQLATYAKFTFVIAQHFVKIHNYMLNQTLSGMVIA